MIEKDYRCTIYESKFCTETIHERKNIFMAKVREKHKIAVDIYGVISKHRSEYEDLFMCIYNNKCSYCGVSIDIVSRSLMEIDHYICKDDNRYAGNKPQAGKLDNLVLACYTCNRGKGKLKLNEPEETLLFPDNDELKKVFYRDEDFYIQISENFKDNKKVAEFYKELKLSHEVRRVDYLLMSLIGIQKKIGKESEIYLKLGNIISKLQRKRNIMKIK